VVNAALLSAAVVVESGAATWLAVHSDGGSF
jgi:hypothetical protein